LGVYTDFISRNKEKYGFELNYAYAKNDPRYKAIYQNYDWCYQKRIVEGKNPHEMAEEAGCSYRVIEKWCTEKHHLTKGFIKKNTKLNETQRELILASMLGDGHIDKRENSPIFIVNHAVNQKDYLFWKYDILKNLCNVTPRYVTGKTIKINGKEYVCQDQYRVATRELDCLKEIRSMSKSEIISGLNEFELAIFFLDDGYNSKSNFWDICIASFSKEEKELFVEYLKNEFGINCRPRKDIRYIGFGREDSDKINQIILKNIPNDLDVVQYKILEKLK
jgi:hypothetical protein